MSPPATPHEVERFRALVASRLGLDCQPPQLAEMGRILAVRAAAHRETHGCYLDRLQTAASRDEIGALAQELTVGETYFFRNAEQFLALSEVALPDRIAANGSTRRLRLLSAGCASGEEPYSLAMVVQAHPLASGWDATIVGADLNESALKRAAAGRYTAWSLRETSAELRDRWFRASGDQYVLDPAIRAAVRFEQHNLAEDPSSLWGERTYDIVFCRNVLMYMTPDAARALVDRMTRALAPGGYLFLGHAENLRGVSDAFDLRNTHGAFYYRRKGGTEVVARPREADPGWLHTIRRSSERIERLSDDLGTTPRANAPGSSAATLRPDRARAMECLKEERFQDALEALGQGDAADARDPEVLLLRAALLAHTGRFEEAERACADLQGVDGLDAGAHYVLALCREGVGDATRAVDHHRMAAQLDPAFAMPRLHLGLLSRRAGRIPEARRELERALRLLGGEAPSRILLFGGGFTRDALVSLCRAELSAAGGTP